MRTKRDRWCGGSETSRRASRPPDQVFEDRYTTAFVQDGQMEPRSALAHWQGDKVTLYTPTQGISNCRHDNARDLGLEDHQVQIICKYMGGGFGDKNGSYYFDLIAAMLAKEADAPVLLELTRKDDWLGTHGRWHTIQDFKVGVKRDGTVTAIQMRGYSGMGPYLRRSGGVSGIEAFACPNSERVIYPVHTNRMVSGNFRAPSDPQGYFAVQSMMDDIAYKLGVDPVDFALKNMLRPTEDVQFTNYSMEECVERGVELFDWQSRRRSVPGSDPGPIKRGAGMSFMMFRSGVRPEQRDCARGLRAAVHTVRRRHGHRPRGQNDDGTHRRRGAGCAVVAGGGRPGAIPIAARIPWASRGAGPQPRQATQSSRPPRISRPRSPRRGCHGVTKC